MTTTASTPWLLAEPSEDAEFRLLCFPYSGCGASMFRSWPERIGPVEIVPLQLPFRENRMREPHFGTYEQLASDLLDGIAPLLNRPYGLFGHCGGALPAFETLLQIEERGLPAPARTFVSSQVAPQDGPYGRFLVLGADELRAELVKLLAALGSEEPRPDLLDLVLEVMDADLDANRAYAKPAIPVSSPLTVIGWDDDVEVPHERMAGWSAWSATEKHVLSGTHYTFLAAPQRLQDVLRSGLAGS